MKNEITWLKGALASKGIVVNMTFYKLTGSEIRATDGALIAGYPFSSEEETLVPGEPLEKVLASITTDPEIKFNKTSITIKCGDFKAVLPKAPPEQWGYPGVESADWEPIPENFLEVMETLRPFISQNATQPWANCIALKDGWAYATNNVAVAGMPCPSKKTISTLVPIWAIDFVLKRQEGLAAWFHDKNFVAFKWDNGAWMRSQIVLGEFPITAFKMVEEAFKTDPTQAIDESFRLAFARLKGLVEDPIAVYKDKLSGRFQETQVEESIPSHEVPSSRDFTLWASEFISPVVAVATHWQPKLWPKPVPFKGKNIAGMVMGRTV